MKIYPYPLSLPLAKYDLKKKVELPPRKDLFSYWYAPLVVSAAIYAILQLNSHFSKIILSSPNPSTPVQNTPPFFTQKNNNEWLNSSSFDTHKKVSDNILPSFSYTPLKSTSNAPSAPVKNEKHLHRQPKLDHNDFQVNKYHRNANTRLVDDLVEKETMSYWDYLKNMNPLYYTLPLSALAIYASPLSLKTTIYQIFKFIVLAPYILEQKLESFMYSSSNTLRDMPLEQDSPPIASYPISEEWLKQMFPFVRKIGINDYV